MINKPIIYKFFKDFNNYRKKTNNAVVTGWYTGTIDGTFQQSGKQDFFQHILKISVSIYGSSHSQFFRTTTGIQSGPDTFDKSRLVITFLTNLGVTETLSSFRLALEGKISNEIPKSSRFKFLEKFLANKFPLSDAEDNTSRPLNKKGIENSPLLRALLAICKESQKPSLWEVTDSYFISICKFGSFKNPFPTITSLSGL